MKTERCIQPQQKVNKLVQFVRLVGNPREVQIQANDPKLDLFALFRSK